MAKTEQYREYEITVRVRDMEAAGPLSRGEVEMWVDGNLNDDVLQVVPGSITVRRIKKEATHE
jgi:hypothetical protein